ncbi:MAG: hypothetical protein QF441_11060 [Bacteriovoracaceae bacterium]|jgi:hypothetical protein|nr:hypothetical protein [Halobacteriovoraceae bacterium]MDP7321141.1 hypothetical protein [Bacteriovoracaceae bacterium]
MTFDLDNIDKASLSKEFLQERIEQIQDLITAQEVAGKSVPSIMRSNLELNYQLMGQIEKADLAPTSTENPLT